MPAETPSIKNCNNGEAPWIASWQVYISAYRKQRKAGTVTSERQKAANQANALHSTGPKSPEGKAAIRFNAFRHGLLAQDAVLPGEDPDAFEDLWNRVRANLSPVGPIEEFLVDRVVNAMWRLQRLARAETALFNWRVHGLKADRLTKQVRSYEETFVDRFSLPTDITDKAAHAEAGVRRTMSRASTPSRD